MNIRTIFLFILIIATSLNAEQEIRIGVISDFTGKGAFFGQQTRNGAVLAENELTAKGKKIKLIFADHHMDTKIAITEAQKMLTIDKVNAIYSEFAGPSVAIASAIKSSPTVLLYSASAISPLKDNPNTFKSLLDFRKGCSKLLQSFKAQGFKKIGFIGHPNETSELCLQEISSQYPEIYKIENTAQSHLSSEILNLKKNNIEAIISINYENEFVSILKILETYNYNPVLGSFGDIITTETRKSYINALKNTEIFTYNAASPTFLKKLSILFPDNDPITANAAAISYLHINQLYSALSKCGADIKCQKDEIAKSLPNQEFGFNGFKDRIAVFEVLTKKLIQ